MIASAEKVPAHFMTVQEVAAELCCSARTLKRRRDADPRFPLPVPWGGMLLFVRSEVKAYISRQENERVARLAEFDRIQAQRIEKARAARRPT